MAAYESNDKMVSHPQHYQSKSGLEVIDVVDAFTEGLEGIEATDTGNIIKYACRWKQKNGIQDLEKIMWYTQHLIDHLKKKATVEKLEEPEFLRAYEYIEDPFNMKSFAFLEDSRRVEIYKNELKACWCTKDGDIPVVLI